jgi:leucyl-tRNA synthetase
VFSFKPFSEPEPEKEPPMTQYEILLSLNITHEQIPKFIDAKYWLEYFPPIGQHDLERFGINTDWRRSFITTEENQFYDSFIRW